MKSEAPSLQLAPPFDRIFADRAEAELGFEFLRQTLDLLDAGSNAYRPCILTLPKSYKSHLLRFNFGPWLLVDFCGAATKYGKRINLALLNEGSAVERREEWFVFNYPHAQRLVGVYQLSWAEVQRMDDELAAHYEASMRYAGELFTHWRGSPYRLAHQPQIFAGIFDSKVRAEILAHGLDPIYIDPMRGKNEDEPVKGYRF